jgi:predicted RNA-binding Zn ribbon-like protein
MTPVKRYAGVMDVDEPVVTDRVPDAARLLRDFVNTAEPQVSGELLASPDDLQRWAAERGLLPGEGKASPLSAADLAAAVAVREGLRCVLQSHAGHDTPDDSGAALDDALERVPLRASFDPAGRLRLAPAADGALTTLVAGLLDAVRRASVDGSWDRLKVCARDSCRWAFYDASRNRSGRWCSMAGCGNQVKMRRAHARRRDTARA